MHDTEYSDSYASCYAWHMVAAVSSKCALFYEIPRGLTTANLNISFRIDRCLFQYYLEVVHACYT
jgi:hypothetical protein